MSNFKTFRVIGYVQNKALFDVVIDSQSIATVLSLLYSKPVGVDPATAHHCDKITIEKVSA